MGIFIDTGAYIAISDKNDEYHRIATEIYNYILNQHIDLVTSNYIFDETVTWIQYKIGHKGACTWGNNILNSNIVSILDVDYPCFKESWKIFVKYKDQKFSFTDCSSFALMKSENIRVAFGYDSHFMTMGYHLIGDDLSHSQSIVSDILKEIRGVPKH